MMDDLLGWSLLILTGYTGLPTLCMRMGLAGAVRRGGGDQPQLALTFDDGPHPTYTPMILDILARHGVPGCFFTLGSKAEEHPGLVRQVVAVGHEIGVHGYHHRVHAVLGPAATFREVRRTVQVLGDIAGRPSRYFRPPWGVFNLWSTLAASRLGLVPVVWSVHPADWRATGSAALCRRTLRQVHPGTVLLLHDGCGPGADTAAPMHLAKALPRIIAGLRARGYQLVSVGQIVAHQHGKENGLAATL